MSQRLSIRLPPPLPPLTTGDAALDAALRAIVDAYETRGIADTQPLVGAGGRLAPALVPELLDGGETRWDEAVALIWRLILWCKRMTSCKARMTFMRITLDEAELLE